MEEQEDENLNEEETEEDDKIKYTLPQRVFIYESYIRSDSTKICRRQFRETFPNIPPPKKSRIIRLANNFRKTGLLLDAKKIEDKHIKELENEAEENKKRRLVIPIVLESSVVEDQSNDTGRESFSNYDQNSVSEVGSEDISCMIKPEIKIKTEPPEHDDFDLARVKKEAKDGDESSSSGSSDEPSSALQAPEWGLVEENPAPSTFPTPDALPYPCRHCGCCFRTYTDLKSHITEMHAEMVRCKECGKEFPTRTQLQRHEAQHATKPPFICVKCNKEYLSQGRLTSHIKKSHVKCEKPKIKEEKKTKKKKK